MYPPTTTTGANTSLFQPREFSLTPCLPSHCDIRRRCDSRRVDAAGPYCAAMARKEQVDLNIKLTCSSRSDLQNAQKRLHGGSHTEEARESLRLRCAV